MIGDDQPIRDRLDDPVLALSRESLVRAGIITNCREWVGNDRCPERADFVLWGKLFDPEALGPRCYDHAVEHTHWTMPTRSDQWAVIDLRQIAAVRQTNPACVSRCRPGYVNLACAVHGATTCPGACTLDGVVDNTCPVHGPDAVDLTYTRPESPS